MPRGGNAISSTIGNVANVGAGVQFVVSNTDNTNGASSAHVLIQSGGSSGGDPYCIYTVTSATDWSHGIDNSDSDAWLLSKNNVLGTNNVMRSSTAGEVTFPLTPAFLATHSVAQDNATGAGAAATVNFTTEIFDQNSDYDGTNTFTAPITGRYRLSSNVYAIQITALMTQGNVTLVTSNRNYFGSVFNPATVMQAGTDVSWSVNTLADMDAADTATVVLTIGNGAGNTADIAAGVTLTYFSGNLEC